jgi:hypothetical protein
MLIIAAEAREIISGFITLLPNTAMISGLKEPIYFPRSTVYLAAPDVQILCARFLYHDIKMRPEIS